MTKQVFEMKETETQNFEETVQPKGRETVAAPFDYEEEQAGHLAFKKGDIIVILEKNEDGLWLGELYGKKGMVPSHFFTQPDEKLIIAEFLEKNSINGIEMLATLIIDHKNIAISNADENFQEIKSLLDDESYEPIIREGILKEIADQTKVDDSFRDDYTVAEILAWVFVKTWSCITALKLTFANLGNLSPAQWAALFAGLKGSSITSLDLYSTNIENLSPAQWSAFFAGLKDSDIASLNLSGNNLGIFDQWTTFFAGLKGSNITSLDFSYNKLSILSREQWTAFFAGLKGSDITVLNLNNNNLGHLCTVRWTAFCAGLKSSAIIVLDLSLNNLSSLSPNQWTEFFLGLKCSGITSLDLSNNQLDRLYTDDWTAFIAGFKGSDITLLGLEGNNLNSLRIQEVTEIIQEKNAYFKIIEKNARVLGYLRYDTNSRFSKLPVELLQEIASGMGNDEHLIEKDEKAEKIVEQNFPKFDSDKPQDRSKKADEEFQKYSSNFKF